LNWLRDGHDRKEVINKRFSSRIWFAGMVRKEVINERFRFVSRLCSMGLIG